MELEQGCGWRRKDLGLELGGWVTSVVLLSIRIIDRKSDAEVRDFCGVKEWMDQKIDENCFLVVWIN